MKNTTSSKSRAFRIGGFSVLLSAAVIGIAIVINLLLSSLPAAYTRYDVSANGLFSISEETMDIVRNIGEDITLYLIAENGTEDSTITELLGRYTSLNRHLTLKRIDPATNPNFTKKYTDEALSANSLIIESARRSYVLDYSDIFVTTYSDEELMYYYYYNVQPTGTTTFDGEGKITGALEYVTSDSIPTLYLLNGHRESAFDNTMAGYIADDNYDTAPLDLLTAEAVPDDASAVIVNAPQSDITAIEAEKLQAYLAKGGTLMMLTDYSVQPQENLTVLAGQYGAQAVNGLLVEGNQNYYVSGYPYYLIPRIQNNAVSELITNTNIRIALPFAHAITTENVPSNVTVTDLFTTSGAAYVKQNIQDENLTLEKESGDPTGSFKTGVLLTDSATGARIVWISSPYLVNSNVDQTLASGGNATYFLSLLSYLCEKGVSVSIAAKSMQVQGLVISDLAANCFSVLIIVLLPLAAVGIGLGVWYKRRNR